MLFWKKNKKHSTDNICEITFSYSRNDADFVLKLGKSLRKEGASIWLDQLDLIPGQRWDKSIEAALDNSYTLLVILSNSSIQSSNVIDEVLFAFNKHKRVVPILLEECDIPQRLKKLQFLDFRGSFKKELNVLIDYLDFKNNTQDFEGPIVSPRISNRIDSNLKNSDDFVLNGNYNVFISYNHGDLNTALKIRDLIKNSGLEVTIDQDSMYDGQEIKNFISSSIQKANVVLTLISNKSLESGWVGVETFETMFAETQNGQRKLIGCVLDSDFYNYDYTMSTIEKLDAEIKKRKKVLIKQLNQGVSVTDISTEIDRLRNLRQNFPETIKRLRDFKCIDVSKEEIIEKNIEKFVNQLKRAQVI